MLRRINNKQVPEIAAEWDALAPLRYEQIKSGVDVSYNRVITPALLRLLDDFHVTSILDVGCGTGLLANNLSQFSDKVVGIDPSKRSIEIAQRLGLTRASFFQSTAEEYSIEHGACFNVVIANMVLMDALNLDSFLDACKRMLVTNGLLAFSMTHPCFWPEYYGYSAADWFDYQDEIIIESPFRISADRTGSLVSTHVHRPLSTYLNSFSRCGFVLKRICEPKPPADADETYRSAWKSPRYLVGLLQG